MYLCSTIPTIPTIIFNRGIRYENENEINTKAVSSLTRTILRPCHPPLWEACPEQLGNARFAIPLFLVPNLFFVGYLDIENLLGESTPVGVDFRRDNVKHGARFNCVP